MLEAKLIGDASRNVVLTVRGVADADVEEPQLIFNMDDLTAKSASRRGYIKISSAWWLIQEKALLVLQWSKDEKDIVFPMESRNAISFLRFVDPPEKWEGKMYLQVQNVASCNCGIARFAFCLDFDR